MNYVKRDHFSELKMSMIKKVINYVAPKILRLSKGVQASTPQSRLILRVWSQLEAVLEKASETGCFSDENFKTLLEATKQALIFLCEKDKYYKRWTGLLAFTLSEELRSAFDNFSYDEALNMTTRPLGLTREEFEKHKLALFELHYCGYLNALRRLSKEESSLISEARAQNRNLDLQTLDPQAYIKLIFPEGSHMSFAMLFGERHAEKRKG